LQPKAPDKNRQHGLPIWDFALAPHGIELNLGKSARRAINFSVPALALAAHFV